MKDESPSIVHGVREQPFTELIAGLFALAALFLLNFVSRVLFAPLLPTIQQDLGLSHTGSGSLFLCISSGYFVSILSSGFISSRLSHKTTIALSTVLTGVILCFVTLCTSAGQLRLLLVCLGLSAGLYLPSGIASITAVVPSAYLARAIAIHEMAPNIGFVTAPLCVAYLTMLLPWDTCLVVFGVVLIVVGMSWWRKGFSGGDGVEPNIAVCLEIMGKREFQLMVLLFSMAICSTIGIYTMLPLYLVAERGFTQLEANQWVSVSRIFSVIMPFVGGWAGDRFGNRLVTALVLLGAGLLTIPFGVLHGPSLLVIIVLQAMVAVCFFPSGFVILSGLGAAGSGNVVVSLCIPPAFVIGSGVMPSLIGLLGDLFSLGMGFVCVGIIMGSLGVVALLVLPKQHLSSSGNRRMKRRDEC